MSEAFQWLVDTAETMSMNRKPLVAKTYSRNGIVRSVSRGFNIWRFSVKLPDGRRWTDDREYISYLEALNETGVGTFNLANSGYDWMVKYLGDQPSFNDTIQVSLPGESDNQNEFTIEGGVNISSGFLFRAGDFIQTKSGATLGSVYVVREDVAWDATVIKCHRPMQSEPANFYNLNSVNLLVGPNVQWEVQCVQMPNWTFFARDQVSWGGEFVLQEVLT